VQTKMKNNSRLCIMPATFRGDPDSGCAQLPPHSHVSGRHAEEKIASGEVTKIGERVLQRVYRTRPGLRSPWPWRPKPSGVGGPIVWQME
jgi:hypothetical protein